MQTVSTQPLPVQPSPHELADSPPSGAKSPAFISLAVASIGIVYGDIGTSPIYALRESLSHAVAARQLCKRVDIAAQN